MCTAIAVVRPASGLWLSLAWVQLGLAVTLGANAAERPNVLLIMVDDLGYGDLSCYGGQDIRTPHVDRLMSRSVRFNEFYANCCVCSPTRAALLSGRYPELVGVPGVVRTHREENWGYLTPGCVLLPTLFQNAGYHTSLVGKWHLGLRPENHPNRRGFDAFKGFLGDMMDDYWNHRRHGINYMRENQTEIDPEGHATDLFTQWSIDMLKEYAKRDQPFFHFLAYNAPHTPIQPPDDWLVRVREREPRISAKRAKIVALIEHLDHGIGQVLATLIETGLSEKTIVVFTSDNGGQLTVAASNGPLCGGKTQVYEGGLKVCTCFRWPGRLPARTTDFRALTMDIVPTLADLCGVPIRHEINGQSFKQEMLTGDQEPLHRTDFHMWLQRDTKEAVRLGDWKLLRDRAGTPFELYNLARDPNEQTNLADQEPFRLERMAALLEKHMELTQSFPWQRPVESPAGY